MRSGIYKWTSPSDKSYIGQAIDLERRYNYFLNNPETIPYTSFDSAIDRARRKYPDFSTWKYEILEEICTDNKSEEQVKNLLDEREVYYIKKYDTYSNGYNSTKGGKGTIGKTGRTTKQISAIKERRDYRGKNNPNYGHKLSDKARENIRKARIGSKASIESRLKKSRAINQYDLNGNFIKTWKLGATDAMRQLSIDKASIGRVCKGIKQSAGGFKWGYLS